MKHLTAKIMITLACAIILVHAIVPHHHHDCADERGFVFETEINCHCSHQHHPHDCNNNCNDHHSDHPFDICRLADMLSHLVLNTKEDDNLIAWVVKVEVHNILTAAIPSMGIPISTAESEHFPAPTSLGRCLCRHSLAAILCGARQCALDLKGTCTVPLHIITLLA